MTRYRGFKRKRGIHPCNNYAENPPDFHNLASLYPSFQPFVFYAYNGRPNIDWTDFNATRELTRVLLLHDYAIKWWIPHGQLCPTVPNRANYIHWIEYLLSSDLITQRKRNENGDGVQVRGFDIGTGANCIYPLLGAALHGWHFVASDVTQAALEWAQKNVENNPHLIDLIEIRKVEYHGEEESFGNDGCTQINKELFSDGIYEDENGSEQSVLRSKLQDGEVCKGSEPLEESSLAVLHSESSCSISKNYEGPPVLLGVVGEGEHFDYCMCNPPFFESMDEAGANPRTACGGTMDEMVCPGGELAFITRIIEDSVQLKEQIRWYTTMVGRKVNLKALTKRLRKVGVTIIQTTEFVQGRTSRWGLAWSFISPSSNIIGAFPKSEKANLSFMLEGLQRTCSALQVLHSVEQFFLACNASCKTDLSLFSVTVQISDKCCRQVLKDCSRKYGIEPSDEMATESIDKQGVFDGGSDGLSFRVSVFEQTPGTLLVKGSSIQKESMSARAFSVLFLRMEETFKEKLGAKFQRTIPN